MEEVESFKTALVKKKQKVKRLWKENCDLSLAHEDEVDLKNAEIAKLQGKLRKLTNMLSQRDAATHEHQSISTEGIGSHSESMEEMQPPTDLSRLSVVLNVRRGKAPPSPP